MPSKEIEFVQGNAKDICFIRKLISDKHFDVVVDFMLYSEEEFKERYELLLSACDQYIFFSSPRVYAESDMPISEISDRLFDVSTDKEFPEDGKYSLTKAKKEDRKVLRVFLATVIFMTSIELVFELLWNCCIIYVVCGFSHSNSNCILVRSRLRHSPGTW